MSDRTYVDDLTFEAYLSEVRELYPRLHALLDPRRIEAGTIEAYTQEMDSLSWEFEDKDVGGRGVAWARAQDNLDNRRVGMTGLMKYFSPSYREMPGPEFQILDVLGGSGAIARFLSTLEQPTPTVFTADRSKAMISACRAKKLPYIRQAASRSLLRDGVLDGVLIAYGAQLLDPQSRRLAAQEAYRTLKPGHRLVLHAFEAGQGVANFFDEVVHPYSRTGHPHRHFTRGELQDLFAQAGFRDFRFFDMSDPIMLRGQTPEDAKRNAIMHMYSGYDLVKLATSQREIEEALEPLIVKTLSPIAVSREQDHYIAEIARTTLIAVGVKSQ
ncbi:MAG: class I SAM-dependent methyltransferase [Pseudomonadota bacterium]